MRRIFFAFVLFSSVKSRSLTDILFPAEKAENNAKAIEQELDNSLVSVSKIRMQLIDTLKGSIVELNKVNFLNPVVAVRISPFTAGVENEC